MSIAALERGNELAGEHEVPDARDVQEDGQVEQFHHRLRQHEPTLATTNGFVLISTASAVWVGPRFLALAV